MRILTCLEVGKRIQKQIKETEKDLKENRDWWQPGIRERPRTHFCSWGMASCEAELGGAQARGKSDDLRDPQGR